jgi:hypothetical protein
MREGRWTKRIACMVGLLLCPLLALAQVEAGPEIRLSWGGDFPSVAALGDTTAVVWQDHGVRGLLFRPDPAVPIQAGDATARLPQIAMDGDGDLVLAWQGNDGAGSGIFARRLRKNGAAQGQELQVNRVVLGNQSSPQLGVAPSGSFAIGWEDTVAGADAIRLARFGASGRRLGRPITLQSDRGARRLLGGVEAADFGVALGWTEVTECAGGMLDLTAAVARFNASGQSQGRVDRFNNAEQCWGGPVMAGILGSEFGPLGVFDGDSVVSIQRFSPVDGERVGERSVVASSGGCDAGYCKRVVAVAGDPRGRVIVVWETRTVDGSSRAPRYDLFAQLFGREGLPRSPFFQINSTSSWSEQHPAAALTAAGDFRIAWRLDADDAYSSGLLYRTFVLSGQPFCS